MKYVFPAYDGSVITSFRCWVGNYKLLEGAVKAKEAARAEFQHAVSHHKVAVLVEELAPEVFETNVGNIPGQTIVRIEITYANLLKVDNSTGGLVLTIPTSIAPRYGVAPEEYSENQSLITDGLQVSVQTSMPAAIRQMESRSHPISVELGAVAHRSFEKFAYGASSETFDPSKGRATLADISAVLDRDFVLYILCSSQESTKSQALAAAQPGQPNLSTVAVTIHPGDLFLQNVNTEYFDGEIIFMADRSGSMRSKVRSLSNVMNVFLRSLPQKCSFNIASFGSDFAWLWPASKEYRQENLNIASQHVGSFNPTLIKAPHDIPVLNTFSYFSLYYMLESGLDSLPTSIALSVTTDKGEKLTAQLPLQKVTEQTAIHHLAAKALMNDYETGKSWLHTQNSTLKSTDPAIFDRILEQEAQHLGQRWSITGKWTSYIAVDQASAQHHEVSVHRADTIEISQLTRPRQVHFGNGWHLLQHSLPPPQPTTGNRDFETDFFDFSRVRGNHQHSLSISGVSMGCLGFQRSIQSHHSLSGITPASVRRPSLPSAPPPPSSQRAQQFPQRLQQHKRQQPQQQSRIHRPYDAVSSYPPRPSAAPIDALSDQFDVQQFDSTIKPTDSPVACSFSPYVNSHLPVHGSDIQPSNPKDGRQSQDGKQDDLESRPNQVPPPPTITPVYNKNSQQTQPYMQPKEFLFLNKIHITQAADGKFHLNEFMPRDAMGYECRSLVLEQSLSSMAENNPSVHMNPELGLLRLNILAVVYITYRHHFQEPLGTPDSEGTSLDQAKDGRVMQEQFRGPTRTGGA